MSWTSALNYAKAITTGYTADPERVDLGLPMNARIGSLMKFQLAPFLRASTAGGLGGLPERTDGLICSIGRVDLPLDGKVHRFYTARGDDPKSPETFLQVYTDHEGQIAETLHCTRIASIVPESKEDLDCFTGEGGAGLGQTTFSLYRSQLAEQGVNERVLNGAFPAGQEAIEYTRDAGGAADYVAPFNGAETRVDDARGETGLKRTVWYMPYVRSLANGDRECLLVTTEVQQERDGRDRREIHVNFCIGVPLEIERVVAIQ